MRVIAQETWPALRMVMVTGAATGVLAGLALLLWARYGTAAFYEQLAAGLGICF